MYCSVLMEFINTLYFETKQKQQHRRISKVLKCLTVHLTMDENLDLLVKKKSIDRPSLILVGVSKTGLADVAPTYWSESHASALELHFLIVHNLLPINKVKYFIYIRYGKRTWLERTYNWIERI